MTSEDCRRKMEEIDQMRRIVSFGPDRARLTRQYEEVEQECERLERAALSDAPPPEG